MTDLAYSLRANEQLCRSLLDKCRPIISGAVPTITLADDELAAVAAAIRRAIEGDRYPHAPRLDPLRAALARLDAAKGADADKSASSKNNANKSSDAVKAGADKSASALSGGTPHPKAPPPAKADKRARR
jgi:hypothetical protein